MPDDLRLDADYFANIKVRLLQRRLGDAGVLSHLRLLCFTRKFKPSGVLSGMNAEAIAMAAEWGGDAEQFCQTLSELILIERSDDDQLRIHDWSEVNAWASGTEGRRAHAQKLNHKRWYTDRGIPCADLQCSQCERLRLSQSELKTEQTQSAISSDSVGESSSRSVTSRHVNVSKKKREKTFDEACDSLRLAALLHSLIAERDPKHTSNLQREALHIDRLMRIDGRSAPDIERIIRFAQADPFWSNNILCTEKLRAQFQQLFLRSQQTSRAIPSNRDKEFSEFENGIAKLQTA